MQGGLVSCGKHDPGLPRFSDRVLHDLATSNFNNLVVNPTENYTDKIDVEDDTFLICCPYEKYSSRLHSMAPPPLEKRKIDHTAVRNKLINRNNWLLLYEYSDDVLDAYAGFDYELYTRFFKLTDDDDKAGYVLIFSNNL